MLGNLQQMAALMKEDSVGSASSLSVVPLLRSASPRRLLPAFAPQDRIHGELKCH